MNFIGRSSDKTLPAIVVHDLWKSYGKQPVLTGLNLTVPQGKIVIILGKSGVGKSVLLRQILGLEKPDKGYVEVNGTRISNLDQQELYKLMCHFGMLFQGSALFDSMTVGENVGFYLTQHGDPTTNHKIAPSELKDRIHDALAQVGLTGFETKLPSMLSGGQKRRAALARLIIYRPKILLYDEPTTGLDPITATQINELILKTQHELQATSVIVTHDIHSALAVGDIFALHDEGKISYMDVKERFVSSDNPLVYDFFINAGIPPKYLTIMKNNHARSE